MFYVFFKNKLFEATVRERRRKFIIRSTKSMTMNPISDKNEAVKEVRLRIVFLWIIYVAVFRSSSGWTYLRSILSFVCSVMNALLSLSFDFHSVRKNFLKKNKLRMFQALGKKLSSLVFDSVLIGTMRFLKNFKSCSCWKYNCKRKAFRLFMWDVFKNFFYFFSLLIWTDDFYILFV